MKKKHLIYLIIATSFACSTTGSNAPADHPEISANQSQDHLIMATLWYQRSG